MYTVSRQIHSQYGNIIEISRDEDGIYKTPSQAYNRASLMRREWFTESKSKIRFLIDGQILTTSQAHKWSFDEYKSLPKCGECITIISGDVYSHQLTDSWFCSQACADKNFNYKIEQMSDEEECDL